MKITRRQLRRIIQEAPPMEPEDLMGDSSVGHASAHRWTPEPGDSTPTLGSYIAWASRMGHMTWSASSVLATYLVEERPRDWEQAGRHLAYVGGLEWEDVARDVGRQQSERSIALGESTVKVSKRQLKRIIKEEKRKLMTEAFGQFQETEDPVLNFAQNWASLGSAVQDQVLAIALAWQEGGHEPDWSEAVYEQNPAAIEMASRKLVPSLNQMGSAADFMLGMLEEAMLIYEQGDAEVEADARAAGDERPSPSGVRGDIMTREDR